jgi:methionyl aminopeptidase
VNSEVRFLLAAPNAGDKQILQPGDILKVDFGVHVNGRIVDSAFTLSFEPSPYDELIKAVKDATNTGVKVLPLSMRLGTTGYLVKRECPWLTPFSPSLSPPTGCRY